MAYVGWIYTFEGRKVTGKEKKVEGVLVRELYSLGAMPFAKLTDICIKPTPL
jgi:amidase